MNLANYVDRLRSGAPYKEAAKEIGISHGNLHNIISGKTKQPPPDVLYKISRRYGESTDKSQDIYATLMKLSGHLDWMPSQYHKKEGNAQLNKPQMLSPEIHDIAERLKELPYFDKVATVKSMHSVIDLAILLQKGKSESNNQRRDEEIIDLMPDHINNAFKRILDHDEEAYEDLMKHLSKTLDRADEKELIRV